MSTDEEGSPAEAADETAEAYPPASPAPDPRRRRRRRQRRTFLALVTVVALAGVLAYGHWAQWWTFGDGPAAAARVPCPTQTAVAARQVTVNVYNATQRRGLARAVAKELQARGFRVATITNDTSGRPVRGVAVVRHGPAGRLSAQSVAAQFGKGVTIEADGRATRRVDVVMGNAFRGMRPQKESAAALAPVPTPPGCLPATAPPSLAPTPPAASTATRPTTG